jgi:hypothetical protein
MWCDTARGLQCMGSVILLRRYSFSYGLVHIIVLSSEHPQGPQVEFFLKDMASLQRSVTPWVIVHLHRQAIASPMFPDLKMCIDTALQAAFHFVSKGQTRRGTCSHVAQTLCAVSLQ